MAKQSKFGSAFKSARSAGKKEFTFNGKKYNTKTRDDLKKTPVPAEKPKSSEPTGPKTRPRNKAADKQKSTATKSTAPKSQTSASSSSATKRAVAVETGSRARNQEKARQAARSGTQSRVTSTPKREAQDYPRPAKDVGIAKAKSKIGQAAARRENEPKKKK